MIKDISKVSAGNSEIVKILSGGVELWTSPVDYSDPYAVLRYYDGKIKVQDGNGVWRGEKVGDVLFGTNKDLLYMPKSVGKATITWEAKNPHILDGNGKVGQKGYAVIIALITLPTGEYRRKYFGITVY